MTLSDLDDLGIIEGTNKSSLWSDYLRHYERVLSDFRHREFNLLEIGVQSGASLRMWENYFDRATIIGIDIARVCKAYEGGRIVIEIGSQDDPGFLDAVSRKYPPAIVIDDGSHKPEHITFTFERLFPALAAGGVYIVEDLRGHFGPNLEVRTGPDGISPIASFHAWAESLMSGRVNPDANFNMNKYIFQNIETMEFIPGAVIIRKKGPAIDPAAKIAATEQLLEGAKYADSWSWLAGFILRTAGPIGVGEAAARRAIAMEPAICHHYSRLSAVLERKGDRTGAIEQARKALELAVGTNMYVGFKVNLERLVALGGAQPE